jgi:hypothetical protein
LQITLAKGKSQIQNQLTMSAEDVLNLPDFDPEWLEGASDDMLSWMKSFARAQISHAEKMKVMWEQRAQNLKLVLQPILEAKSGGAKAKTMSSAPALNAYAPVPMMADPSSRPAKVPAGPSAAGGGRGASSAAAPRQVQFSDDYSDSASTKSRGPPRATAAASGGGGGGDYVSRSAPTISAYNPSPAAYTPIAAQPSYTPAPARSAAYQPIAEEEAAPAPAERPKQRDENAGGGGGGSKTKSRSYRQEAASAARQMPRTGYQ